MSLYLQYITNNEPVNFKDASELNKHTLLKEIDKTKLVIIDNTKMSNNVTSFITISGDAYSFKIRLDNDDISHLFADHVQKLITELKKKTNLDANFTIDPTSKSKRFFNTAHLNGVEIINDGSNKQIIQYYKNANPITNTVSLSNNPISKSPDDYNTNWQLAIYEFYRYSWYKRSTGGRRRRRKTKRSTSRRHRKTRRYHR